MKQLYMLLIGCRPHGRHTEQHDVYFGIGESVASLIPEIIAFWPEAKGQMHIDGWRVVNQVNGYQVQVTNKDEKSPQDAQLYFINLGGYKPGEFEEYHYKMLVAAPTKNEAVKLSKQTAFFKHTGFGKKATSHIDDKYGVDVDDIFEIRDILSDVAKSLYSITLQASDPSTPEDEMQLGYFKLTDF